MPNTDHDAPSEHDFLPVKGHPDDDECTYRSDGTDATYCGRPAVEHDHHPNCYQSTGDIPDDLPDDLCDCRVLRTIAAASHATPIGVEVSSREPGKGFTGQPLALHAYDDLKETPMPDSSRRGRLPHSRLAHWFGWVRR